MRLGCQMINFVWLDIVDQLIQITRGCNISIMKVKVDTILSVGVAVNMIDALCIEGACPADQSMNFVTFGEQQFCPIRPILACNASNQRFFHWIVFTLKSSNFFMYSGMDTDLPISKSS